MSSEVGITGGKIGTCFHIGFRRAIHLNMTSSRPSTFFLHQIQHLFTNIHELLTSMTDDMEVDPPSTAAPSNAMAALMAGAKGKAKADAASAAQAEKDARDLEAREGLPWSAFFPSKYRRTQLTCAGSRSTGRSVWTRLCHIRISLLPVSPAHRGQGVATRS